MNLKELKVGQSIVIASNESDAFAKEVVETLTQYIIKLGNQIARQKEAQFFGSSEDIIKVMLPKAKEYFKEAIDNFSKDPSLLDDFFGEFFSDVVRPGLKEAFNTKTKFAGFGPRSIEMQMKKESNNKLLPGEQEMQRKYKEVKERTK